MQNDSITYIDAKNRLFGINFRELWRYRDLIFLLVKRSVRKIEAAKRIAMKFALDSMMELVVPDARDNPI